MITIEDWQEDLQKERSLWDAFVSAQCIKTSLFNFRARCIILVLACSLACWALFVATQIPNTTLMSLIVWQSNNIFTMSVSVLGFLITGFSVFVTLSDRNLLVELAKTPYEESGLSIFKYLFFSFLVVFFVYLTSAIFSFCVGAFAQVAWPYGSTPLSERDVKGINIFAILTLSVVFCELAIRLKAFIWSIYASFVSKLVAYDFLKTVLPSLPRE